MSRSRTRATSSSSSDPRKSIGILTTLYRMNTIWSYHRRGRQFDDQAGAPIVLGVHKRRDLPGQFWLSLAVKGPPRSVEGLESDPQEPPPGSQHDLGPLDALPLL